MDMKRVLALVAAVGIIAAASTASALIVGGKHDMRVGSTATIAGSKAALSTQVCVYCHTPHNSATSLPLWNRNAITGGTFKLYSGAGMANKIYSTGFTNDSPSLFCMSCHDGATNVNNVVHTGGSALTNGTVGGTGDLTGGTGTDLTTTHPVNFPVKLNGQNDLWIGSAGKMGTNNTIVGNVTAVDGFPLYKTSRDATLTNTLECSSCHSVHNYDNKPFLRYTMAASALCLGCHNK